MAYLDDNVEIVFLSLPSLYSILEILQEKDLGKILMSGTIGPYSNIMDSPRIVLIIK